MSGRNFSLTDRLSEFVDEQVASGRHQSASEVVREALRRYQDEMAEEEASLAILEQMAREGIAAIANGDFTMISGRDDVRRLVDGWNARAARDAHPSRGRASRRRG